MRELIKTMGDDIPGLTPRKLTENAVMLSYLRKHFPGEESYLPGLLHPSLYNKDRLQRLIDEVRDESFPDGMNEIGTLTCSILINSIVSPSFRERFEWS